MPSLLEVKYRGKFDLSVKFNTVSQINSSILNLLFVKVVSACLTFLIFYIPAGSLFPFGTNQRWILRAKRIESKLRKVQ